VRNKIVGLLGMTFVFALGIFLTGWASPGQSRASTTTLTVSTTTSGPVTYEPVPSSPDIFFANNLDGWASGGGGIIAASDGGRTWKTVLTSTQGVGPLSFLDSTLGWAVDGGTLMETADGGATWQSVSPLGVLKGATQLRFLDPERGWAVVSEMRCVGDARLQRSRNPDEHHERWSHLEFE